MNLKSSLVITRKRLLILFLSVIFLFCVLSVRLFFLQVISGGELQKKASDQWYRDLPLSAARGKILDANGNVLADNKDAITVYVRPNAVTDSAFVAKELGAALGYDEAALYEKIDGAKVSEITIARKVEPSKLADIRQKDIAGVYYAIETKRNYPNTNYLSQILGFTNIDNQGQNGLEGYYDKNLKGLDGYVYTSTDLAGRETDTSVTKYVPSIAGNNLTLSLDLNIQSFAEYAVTAAKNEFAGKSASMIVMDVTDGGILAMATTPGFDLNEPPRYDIDLLNQLSKNKMIVDVYEPGSTFKIFTTAAAIENGHTRDSDRYYCNGSRLVDGQKIKCWRTIGHGSQTLAEGVMNSCNCVFMDLALRLGTNQLYDALQTFNFGAKTNVDFYGESRGIMMKRDNVKTVDLARIGFGQAVAVTPLQLIAGVSSVVNGGNYFEPYFVKKITDYQGRLVYEKNTASTKKTISAATSGQMCTLLENVVSTGSGKKAQVSGYRIGGKTGTAQKYENGHIAQGKYVSSFVGFAPVENPKYAILMIVDEPSQGAYYGSIVAAPYAGQVFEKIFDYTALKPSVTPEAPELVQMPNLETMSVTDAVLALKSLGLQYEVDGENGKIKSTLPIAGTMVEKGDIVLLRLDT